MQSETQPLVLASFEWPLTYQRKLRDPSHPHRCIGASRPRCAPSPGGHCDSTPNYNTTALPNHFSLDFLHSNSPLLYPNKNTQKQQNNEIPKTTNSLPALRTARQYGLRIFILIILILTEKIHVPSVKTRLSNQRARPGATTHDPALGRGERAAAVAQDVDVEFVFIVGHRAVTRVERATAEEVFVLRRGGRG